MTKREKRARKVASLKREIDWRLANARQRAAKNLELITSQASADPERPWGERTVGDVAMLKMAEWHESEKRALKMASAPVQAFGVVFLPPQAQSEDDWEKFAAETERKAIETTAVQALPPKSEDAA